MATEINSENYEKIIQDRIFARLRRMDPKEGRIRSTLHRIGNQIVAEATLNITRRRGPARHRLNFAGGGDKNLVDSGRLLSSLKQFPVRTRGAESELIVGVFGVVYAAIHEFGGEITPNKGKYMSIPLRKEYRGRNPSSINEDWVFKIHGTSQYLAQKLPNGRLIYAYRLVEKVKMPPRPYFFPAVRKVTPRAINMIRKIFVDKK